MVTHPRSIGLVGGVPDGKYIAADHGQAMVEVNPRLPATMAMEPVVFAPTLICVVTVIFGPLFSPPVAHKLSLLPAQFQTPITVLPMAGVYALHPDGQLARLNDITAPVGMPL